MKRATITLLGIAATALIVLATACNKKPDAAAQAERMAQAAALEAQTENRKAAAQNTAGTASGDDFFFGIETGNGPEYPQFVVDSGGNSFIFHRNIQLKDIRLISIGMSEDGKLYEDNVYAYALEETGFYTNIGFYEEGKRYGGNVFASVPNEIGLFFVMVSVSEGIPTRGIAFTDENGNRKYFYISMSGMDGSVSLSEFKNTNWATTPTADFEIDGTTLVRYTGNGGSVTIPSSVTVIGEQAFRKCESLTSVTIPSSVIRISDAAFAYCYNLTSVNFSSPSSLTTIESSAFCYCESLTSVDIPSSVNEIGADAFFDSTVGNVTISRRTKVGEGAFLDYAQIHYRD
jgi:hypothetical protein